MKNDLEKNPFITWFATNPVVANILMFTILLAGIYTALTVRKEGFPAFAAETVSITVPIRGGTPQDVERGVSIKIEESLETVEGIDHIRSVSSENLATVIVDAKEGYDISKLVNDIKIQVDAIPSFPAEAENAVIEEQKRENKALWIEIYGDIPEAVRKEAARDLRDRLLREPAISKINTYGARTYEIAIEPTEEKLRAYDLTFDEVAQAISENSIDLGGGAIRSLRGDISLRARDQAYRKRDFEEIPVRTNPDGTRIFVKDVANVKDAFFGQRFLNRFRGKPTTSLEIVIGSKDDIIDAVEQARAVIKEYDKLPPGLEVKSWLDGSTNIRDRLALLGKNGALGVLLVLGILMLFLNLRLAFWVALGIPVSLAGAVTFFPLPGLDLSVNVISAFGFLVVLGIVVDDAIVIGESIYSEKEKQGQSDDPEAPLRATVRGVARVVTPATFGVITTIAAFLPLTQVSGRLGNVFGQIATTVVLCLIFSLIESKLILPAHLAHLNVHRKPGNPVTRSWARLQKAISDGLDWLINRIYCPVVRLFIPWRYAVLAGFIAIFILVIGLFPAGQLRFVFFPNIYRDDASVNLELEQGQSVDYLHDTARRIAKITDDLGDKYEEQFGANPFKEVQISASSNTKASIVAELTRSTERENLTTQQIVKDWRAAVGNVAGARSLSFRATAGPPGGDISINLESDDLEELQAASKELKAELITYPGVFDVSDSFASGRPEIRYSLTPAGQAANLTRLDLARNVRDAFYGREAQRVQRGREEVKVMVRYPLAKRKEIETLREMRIRKPDGTTIPFSVAAEAEYSGSLASIERYDNKRVVAVEASADKSSTSSEEILDRLDEKFFPTMLSKYPGISISQSGEAEQRAKSMKSLATGFALSIIFIYILTAIPLRSYLQPLAIMSVIPFGIIGALLGHYLMGIPVSILSVFGILALSGVVVNDSLVMVCHINDERKKGVGLKEACREAGAARFRAIMLTTLTTFFGLAPLLLEKEVQAQFLKPMAASLAFGIVFATLITLFLLPMLLLIFRDIRNAFRMAFGLDFSPNKNI